MDDRCVSMYVCVCVCLCVCVYQRKGEMAGVGRKDDLLAGFDDGRGRHNHEYAIGENGEDDGERKERMDHDEDGHAPDRVERRQQPKGVGGAESVNVLALADHHKRLHQQKQSNQSINQLEIQ